MAAQTSARSPRLQAYLGPLVAVLVMLFSLTDLYERAELVTYDWRFHMRNSLFGPPAIDPRLGTIEISDQSVAFEGRFQDWTRDKYTDVVSLLNQYGARMLGFDVYFIEPSTKLVSEEQLKSLDNIDRAAVMELLEQVDYDAHFAEAIRKAGNVYLAMYLGIVNAETAGAGTERAVEERSPGEEKVLAAVRRNGPQLMVPPEASTLNRAHYIEPPLALLREAARGYAYAQTVADVDGARRRFPLVYQYMDVVFPSIALSMVCDHLEVPLSQVQVWPGDYVLLPEARFPEGRLMDIRIPIDQYGNMNVNWAGRWENTFVRYPHIALRRAYQREQRQQRLEAIKGLVAAEPSLARDPSALAAALETAGWSEPETNRTAMVTWFQAVGIEAALRAEPGLEAADFWRSKGVTRPTAAQLAMFKAVARNRRVAALLRESPTATADELVAALPEYPAATVRQTAAYVRQHMEGNGLAAGASPLFFYPYVAFDGQYVTPENLRGRILYYGHTSTGSTDLSVTPFQGDFPMVGTYPNVINTIVNQSFIERIPLWQNVLLIMAFGVLLSVSVPRLRVLQGAALIALLVVLYAATALLSFAHAGLWLDLVAPLVILVAGYLAVTIYGYVIKEREKDFVQGAFGHYLSPAVVEHILQNPAMVSQLGGEERVMTAFFSDIASFSTISECLTPAELVQFINEYLTEMCDIIESYGGTIDKFEGDAIVAFFGAPIYYEDHASRAALACIDQQRRLVELRERWVAEQSLPVRLEELRRAWKRQGRTFAHVRMGVTAGPMIVGNMGSRSRTDYTIMGDTVNLAARFESGQRIYNIGIMVNDAIHDAVVDQVAMRKLDVIQVTGKEDSVTAYEILDRKSDLDPQRREVLQLYNEGLALYEQFEFDRARKLFEQALLVLPTDGPSALYADRCEDFAENPPEDLVYRAQAK